MELNKKILKVGLILIALSLVITVGLSLKYKLKDPVFLKLYFEQYAPSNENTRVIENFSLKYITNIDDSRKVRDIHFKEEPNIKVIVSYMPNGYGFSFFNNYNNHERGEIYGRYALHTIYLNIDLNNIDEEFYEIELNNVRITFNDNSILDTNIGRLIVYKDKSKMGDLHSKGGSSSSDGTSSSSLMSEKDLKLLEVKSPLLQDLKDYFDLSIRGIDYREVSGIEYEGGKVLNTNSKFHFPKDITQKYTFYDIKPKLYYEDKEGNISYTRIYNINHIPYKYDLKGIFKYLKARGEI